MLPLTFTVFFQVQSVVILNANSNDPASIWIKLDQHQVSKAPFKVLDSQIGEQWIRQLSAKADREVYCLSYDPVVDTFKISEVYRIKKVHLRRQEVALYNPRTDSITGEGNIWVRRANLTGITLVNLVLPWAGGREQVLPEGDDESSLRVIGEYHDLIYDFQNIMGFRLINRRPFDLEFGSNLENGTWSGILGELNTNQADLSSVAYANHDGRKGVVDFSASLGPVQSVLLMSASQGPEWTVWPYVRPFSVLVWGAYLASIVGLVLALYLTGSESPVGTVLVFVIQRGDFGQTRSVSERGALMCLGILTFVMFAHYSAILTTNLTILDDPNPLDTFEEVYQKGKQLIFEKGEVVELILKDAPPGSVENQLYVETVKDNPQALVKSVPEAIAAVLEDSNKVYYSAIGPPIPGTQSHLILSNQMYAMTLPFPPTSEFRLLFNFYIERIKESGLKQQLRRRHTPILSLDHAQNEAGQGLDLSWTFGPFLSVGLGVGLSALILMFESALSQCQS
ncbi:hypothetical protein TCAL_07029 [Tigriopus californicus]|uniref:Ionotropic glutamate receptor L-glutamate and glycine-binding domain-containing protein n=2 Tax=Tigriopus californicus TaxID=6832 RepID=A0A553PDL1_TIGCA|nr:hypothetical protein TCAL_07029 [Tigriopus californicus]